jgi:hypothetical protein
MTEHSFLTEFVSKYGFKEAVVLSELSRRQLKDKEVKIYFTGLRALFPYFTPRQLRTAFENLQKSGCIIATAERYGKNNFKRRTLIEVTDDLLTLYRDVTKENFYNKFVIGKAL